jgi:ribosomal protein S18 acetylase RimI-like enzyme
MSATFQIRAFRAEDEGAVIDLWVRCDLVRPQNNPRTDIQRKMAVDPKGFLVGVLGEEIVASAMAGYDGHRGWIYYLAVAPHLQQSGYGRKIVEYIEAMLRARGCPKINLQVRTSNQRVIDFYKRIGFSQDEVLSMGKRLMPDEPFNRT